MQTRTLRGVLRVAGLLGLSGVLIILSPLFLPFGLKGRQLLRRLWCQGNCWLLNIKVSCQGVPFRACPTLLVANHVSYIDIIALGRFVDGTYIAKSDVAGWPLLGFLSRAVGTFYVKRHWRQALVQRNAIAARMREGESFVLFAEGTSTNGLAVGKFKTSLMSVAEPWILDRPVAVQGVTIIYTRLRDGTPIGRDNCDLYAWYGDMELLPHLWEVLKMDGVELHIVLHEPVLSWSVQSRKVLGRELQDLITRTLAGHRGVACEPEPAFAAPGQAPA